MNSRKLRVSLYILLGVVLVLTCTVGSAYADADNWVLPWYEYDHNLMTSAIVSGSDVPYNVGTKEFGGDKGYWHSLNITFDYSLPYYLDIIAPAAGSVVYSDSKELDVRTYGGDVYGLQSIGTNSQMYSFNTGTQISMGDEVGKVDLRARNPMLTIQYLIGQESKNLFGLARRYYVDGTDLTEYSCNIYNSNQTSGAYSMPDLELTSMWHDGTPLYNTYQPNFPIYLRANVTISGSFNSTYTVRWIVYNEYGNILMWDDLTYTVNDPESQPLFSWTPTQNGTYKVSCEVDVDESIAESDEDNNERYFFIDVDDFSDAMPGLKVGW